MSTTNLTIAESSALLELLKAHPVDKVMKNPSLISALLTMSTTSSECNLTIAESSALLELLKAHRVGEVMKNPSLISALLKMSGNFSYPATSGTNVSDMNLHDGNYTPKRW